MERKIAVQLLSEIEAMTPQFDALASLTDEIDDEGERKEIRKTLAEAIHILGYDLVMRVVRQYPDLDPDKDYFDSLSPDKET